MKKLSLLMLLLGGMQVANAQSSPNEANWLSSNIAYSSTAADNQSQARMSMSYNGQIYATDVLESSGQVYGWELRKSTNNGQTFTTVRLDGTRFLNSINQHVEVYAAGSTAANFKLYVATSWTESPGDIAHLRLEEFNATGVLQSTPVDETYNNSYGYEGIALCGDDQLPSSNSAPFAAALVAIKRAANDEVLAYVTEDGGANFHAPETVYSTSAYVRGVSAAYGTNMDNPYGRLGIAWWETGGASDDYGTSKFIVVYGDDGTASLSAETISGDTRNPAIALAMKSSPVIGGLMLYEKSGVDEYQGIWITDALTNGANTPLTPNAAQEPNANPQVLFNTQTNQFNLGYREGTKHYLEKIAPDAAAGTMPTVVVTAYNDADASVGVSPIDYNPTNGKLGAVWISNSTAYFDGEALTSTGLAGIRSNTTTVRLYPNPATTDIHLACTAGKSGSATFMLTDVTGRVLMEQPVQMSAGAQDVALSLPRLAAGQYLVTLRGADVNFATQLLVK